MLRAMMLALTLMLVTLTAAYLGQDEQLTQVLRQAKTPVESSSYSPQTSAISESSSAGISEKESSHSPRFVMDEPLTNPILPQESEDAEAPSSSEGLDPSAHAQVASSQGDSSYQPPTPTEEQKLATAEPYVKELFDLTQSSKNELDSIADQAISEYLGISPDMRHESLPTLIEKYMPRAQQLEQQTDEKAESILLKMSAALAAIGADDSIVQDAKAAYERSKQEQTNRYSQIFSSFEQ